MPSTSVIERVVTRRTQARVSVVPALVILLLASAVPSIAKDPRVEDDRLAFALPDLDGNPVSSSDERFASRVLLVTLWGTWCPPCRSEIPTFNDLQERYGGDGLVVVGIAFEREDDLGERHDRLRRFADEHAIRYLVLDGGSTTDFSEALPMVVDVSGLPIEILVDRSGLVADCRNGRGYTARWARKLGERVRALLDRRP